MNHRTDWGLRIQDLGFAIFRGNRRRCAAPVNPQSKIQNPESPMGNPLPMNPPNQLLAGVSLLAGRGQDRPVAV
jgi:hypothetical protein